MPQKAQDTPTGTMETLNVTLLSILVAQIMESTGVKLSKDAIEALNLSDMIVFALPDTGSAKFVGSHEITTGKSAGKDSKATFVVAELGSSFAGAPLEWRQSNGDVKGLPLFAKVSIIAQPPNTAGKTVDEALNRKPTTLEVGKTGTDN